MRLSSAAVILLAGSIGFSCAPENPSPAATSGASAAVGANPLLGGWTATLMDFRGLPPEGDPGIRLAFNEETVLWMMEGPSGPFMREGAYTLDLSTTPPRIDLVDPLSEKQDLKKGLFRVAGDELTIVLGDQRPTSFEEGVMGRLVLEREPEAPR